MPTTKSATQVAVTPASSGAGKRGGSSSVSESLSGRASQPRSCSVRLGPGSSLRVAFHMLPVLLNWFRDGTALRGWIRLVREKVSLGAKECEGGARAGSQGGYLERKERGEAVAEREGEIESLRRGGGREMEAERHTHTHTHTHTGGEMDRVTHSSGTSRLPLSLPQRPSLPTQPPASLHTSTCHWGSFSSSASLLRSGSSSISHFPKRCEAETQHCEARARGSAPLLALGAACPV